MQALAIRHVTFEDLGSLNPVLRDRGFSIAYHQAADGLTNLDALTPELLIVLGGPIGVYEEAAYPFLTEEISLLRARLAAGRPTLGICLGAQLMARSLGGNVYPGPRKEIGWAPVELTDEGRRSCLAPLEGIHLLHWHGDTFDLPDGTVRLASTPLYANQAFARGTAALALQFHPEVTAADLEHWFVGHACEIAATDGINVAGLRADTQRFAPDLVFGAERCFAAWLDANGFSRAPGGD